MSNDANLEEVTGMDLRMLTLFGSKERSLEEFNALAATAGLQLTEARPTGSAYWLLEYRVAASSR